MPRWVPPLFFLEAVLVNSPTSALILAVAAPAITGYKWEWTEVFIIGVSTYFSLYDCHFQGMLMLTS